MKTNNNTKAVLLNIFKQGAENPLFGFNELIEKMLFFYQTEIDDYTQEEKDFAMNQEKSFAKLCEFFEKNKEQKELLLRYDDLGGLILSMNCDRYFRAGVRLILDLLGEWLTEMLDERKAISNLLPPLSPITESIKH